MRWIHSSLQKVDVYVTQHDDYHAATEPEITLRQELDLSLSLSLDVCLAEELVQHLDASCRLGLFSSFLQQRIYSLHIYRPSTLRPSITLPRERKCRWAPVSIGPDSTNTKVDIIL